MIQGTHPIDGSKEEQENETFDPVPRILTGIRPKILLTHEPIIPRDGNDVIVYVEVPTQSVDSLEGLRLHAMIKNGCDDAKVFKFTQTRSSKESAALNPPPKDSEHEHDIENTARWFKLHERDWCRFVLPRAWVENQQRHADYRDEAIDYDKWFDSAIKGYEDVMKTFLARDDIKDIINIKDKSTGWTALIHAGLNKHVAVVKTLLKSKDLDVNLTDDERKSSIPLYLFVYDGRINPVKALLTRSDIKLHQDVFDLIGTNDWNKKIKKKKRNRIKKMLKEYVKQNPTCGAEENENNILKIQFLVEGVGLDEDKLALGFKNQVPIGTHSHDIRIEDVFDNKKKNPQPTIFLSWPRRHFDSKTLPHEAEELKKLPARYDKDFQSDIDAVLRRIEQAGGGELIHLSQKKWEEIVDDSDINTVYTWLAEGHIDNVNIRDWEKASAGLGQPAAHYFTSVLGKASIKEQVSEHASTAADDKKPRDKKEIDEGCTLLHDAAKSGNVGIVEALCKRNDLAVNKQSLTKHDTALHKAIDGNHTKVVEILLQRDDIDLSLINHDKQTILLLAQDKKNKDVENSITQYADDHSPPATHIPTENMRLVELPDRTSLLHVGDFCVEDASADMSNFFGNVLGEASVKHSSQANKVSEVATTARNLLKKARKVTHSVTHVQSELNDAFVQPLADILDIAKNLREILDVESDVHGGTKSLEMLAQICERIPLGPCKPLGKFVRKGLKSVNKGLKEFKEAVKPISKRLDPEKGMLKKIENMKEKTGNYDGKVDAAVGKFETIAGVLEMAMILHDMQNQTAPEEGQFYEWRGSASGLEIQCGPLKSMPIVEQEDNTNDCVQSRIEESTVAEQEDVDKLFVFQLASTDMLQIVTFRGKKQQDDDGGDENDAVDNLDFVVLKRYARSDDAQLVNKDFILITKPKAEAQEAPTTTTTTATHLMEMPMELFRECFRLVDIAKIGLQAPKEGDDNHPEMEAMLKGDKEQAEYCAMLDQHLAILKKQHGGISFLKSSGMSKFFEGLQGQFDDVLHQIKTFLTNISANNLKTIKCVVEEVLKKAKPLMNPLRPIFNLAKKVYTKIENSGILGMIHYIGGWAEKILWPINVMIDKFMDALGITKAIETAFSTMNPFRPLAIQFETKLGEKVLKVVDRVLDKAQKTLQGLMIMDDVQEITNDACKLFANMALASFSIAKPFLERLQKLATKLLRKIMFHEKQQGIAHGVSDLDMALGLFKMWLTQLRNAELQILEYLIGNQRLTGVEICDQFSYDLSYGPGTQIEQAPCLKVYSWFANQSFQVGLRKYFGHAEIFNTFPESFGSSDIDIKLIKDIENKRPRLEAFAVLPDPAFHLKNPTSFLQGHAKICWFLAPLSALLKTNRELFFRKNIIFGDGEEEHSDPVSKVSFLLFGADLKWQSCTVDTYLPVGFGRRTLKAKPTEEEKKDGGASQAGADVKHEIGKQFSTMMKNMVMDQVCPCVATPFSRSDGNGISKDPLLPLLEKALCNEMTFDGWSSLYRKMDGGHIINGLLMLVGDQHDVTYMYSKTNGNEKWRRDAIRFSRQPMQVNTNESKYDFHCKVNACITTKYDFDCQCKPESLPFNLTDDIAKRWETALRTHCILLVGQTTDQHAVTLLDVFQQVVPEQQENSKEEKESSSEVQKEAVKEWMVKFFDASKESAQLGSASQQLPFQTFCDKMEYVFETHISTKQSVTQESSGEKTLDEQTREAFYNVYKVAEKEIDIDPINISKLKTSGMKTGGKGDSLKQHLKQHSAQTRLQSASRMNWHGIKKGIRRIGSQQ